MRVCCRAPQTARPGFTAVEMIVVVVVLAITAALVVPRLGSAETSTLRAAARILAADIQLTQSEAMAHPDELRILDWSLSGALRYDVTTVDTPGAPDTDDLITNPLSKEPYRVAYGENAAYDFLHGVWLAKSNLDVADHAGHLHFGAFGQVDLPTHDPAMVLAAGDLTLTVSVDGITGAVAVADTFVPLSQLGSISLPGPSGDVFTQATSPY